MPKKPAKARLFVNGDLTAGGGVDLDDRQMHYLRHVMRLDGGDAFTVFNGRQGEWLAALDGGDGKTGRAALAQQTRPQEWEGDLWFAFAPIKKTRTDFLVEKATELGVARLLPVFTRRTATTRVNRDRLAAHAAAAAEQCGRLTVPVIDEPVSLDRLIEDWPEGRRLLVLDETGKGTPIGEALPLDGSAKACGGGWGLLCGPEGGFAPSELDAVGKLPFVVRVGLGPRILRAETAALAALTCWQVSIGDWRAQPPAPDGRDSPE